MGQKNYRGMILFGMLSFVNDYFAGDDFNVVLCLRLNDNNFLAFFRGKLHECRLVPIHMIKPFLWSVMRSLGICPETQTDHYIILICVTKRDVQTSSTLLLLSVSDLSCITAL